MSNHQTSVCSNFDGDVPNELLGDAYLCCKRKSDDLVEFVENGMICLQNNQCLPTDRPTVVKCCSVHIKLLDTLPNKFAMPMSFFLNLEACICVRKFLTFVLPIDCCCLLKNAVYQLIIP